MQHTVTIGLRSEEPSWVCCKLCTGTVGHEARALVVTAFDVHEQQKPCTRSLRSGASGPSSCRKNCGTQKRASSSFESRLSAAHTQEQAPAV